MKTMESTFPIKIEAIKTEYSEAESTSCLQKQEGIKLDLASTSFFAKKEKIDTELSEAASLLVKKEETDFSDVASTSYLARDVDMKTERDKAASTSSPRKRELKEENCVSEEKKAKTEPAETASTSRCVDPNDTPIGKVTNSASEVNVSGKVIYCTQVHDWRGGRKMYFDLSDETGVIRVIAWNGVASTAAELVQLDKTIQLKNAEVRAKHPIYNNLDHPCELALNSNNRSLSIRELRNCPIRATPLETCFISFGEARRKPANKSFDVSGTIKEFYSGYGGEEHDLQVVTLKGEDGELEINVWNKYIELSPDMVGKKMDVIRCTYESARDRVDSMGAHVNIDGRRVEKYHLASAKFKSSGIGGPLDFFLALAGSGYCCDDDYDGWGEDYDGSYDDYDGSYDVDSEDSDEDGDEGSVDNSDDVSYEENSAGLESSVL